MLLDILLIFLAAAGGLLVLWCVAGLFFAPVFDQSTVCHAYITDDAEALEEKVRAYAWLRGSGFASGEMVLIDRGITPEAMSRVRLLQNRHPWLLYKTEEGAE